MSWSPRADPPNGNIHARMETGDREVPRPQHEVAAGVDNDEEFRRDQCKLDGVLRNLDAVGSAEGRKGTKIHRESWDSQSRNRPKAQVPTAHRPGSEQRDAGTTEKVLS